MRLITIIVIIIILAGAAAGIYQWTNDDAKEEPGPVQTETAAVRTLSSAVLATGTIRPRVGAEVKVGARISGQVTRLFVTVGSQVRDGQIIAELDQVELRARRDQAIAAIELETAAMAGVKRILDRTTELHEGQLVATEEMEQAQTGYNLALARIKRAEADLALIDVQIGYTTIRTPIAGVVASVSTQEGESISAGLAAPTFVTIINLDRLEAIAFVDETDIGRVVPGYQTSLTVDTYPDREFTGTVRAIAPKAVIQSSVVNYEVSIDLDNPDGFLKPDMTTNTNILTESREVLCLSNRAIRRDAEGAYIMLAQAGDIHERRMIRTGQRSGSYTEIVQGLNAGDRVVIE